MNGELPVASLSVKWRLQSVMKKILVGLIIGSILTISCGLTNKSDYLYKNRLKATLLNQHKVWKLMN